MKDVQSVVHIYHDFLFGFFFVKVVKLLGWSYFFSLSYDECMIVLMKEVEKGVGKFFFY